MRLQGLRLANFFLKQGTMAQLEGQKFPRQSFAADPAQFVTGAPLAVLINRGTYGPAELTAAAIGELKRGDVVGERSFGEGSVQKTIELPDGAALLLTVAKYQGPDGKKIQDEAVAPTVAVGATPEDDDAEPAQPKGDEALAKAIALLKAGNAGQVAQPVAEAENPNATPPAAKPAVKKESGIGKFFRHLFGTE